MKQTSKAVCMFARQTGIYTFFSSVAAAGIFTSTFSLIASAFAFFASFLAILAAAFKFSMGSERQYDWQDIRFRDNPHAPLQPFSSFLHWQQASFPFSLELILLLILLWLSCH